MAVLLFCDALMLPRWTKLHRLWSKSRQGWGTLFAPPGRRRWACARQLDFVLLLSFQRKDKPVGEAAKTRIAARDVMAITKCRFL
jgi:hypothetical protein